MKKATMFRQLISLPEVRGRRALWLPILGPFLDREFRMQVDSNDHYKGQVFIDRDQWLLGDGDREERQVAKLFFNSRKDDRQGCLTYGTERIRLLGFQWPTQGGRSEKSRRADLVGLTKEGGLVVFEAKIATGTHTLSAIMEGLDYLSCLLREPNFKKIETGFKAWNEKPGQIVAEGFESVAPKRNVRPTLVLLAPEAYYKKQSRTPRGSEWLEIAKQGESWIESVRVIVAQTDFDSPPLTLPKDTRPKPKNTQGR